ncbi:MAG: hypothetical protein RJA10_2955 [Pseudomonadota bacterium]|jgi:DNA-binding CsgD family transcriptional regulator
MQRMILSTREHAALGRLFGLLAEGLPAHELRRQLGAALLDLLQADHFASFVWDADARRFDQGVWINMDASNLKRYADWYQFRDPITLPLQMRRHATAVSEVMPHAELLGTEFFNDFLARDGLHWGINLHAFDGARALGDLRVWRGRHRREFDDHDKALLDLIEPAFRAALRRAAPPPGGGPVLSTREHEVAAAVARGLTDKEIARELGLSPSSVRTYLNRLFDKTGTHRRAGLVRWIDLQRAGGGRRPNSD